MRMSGSGQLIALGFAFAALAACASEGNPDAATATVQQSEPASTIEQSAGAEVTPSLADTPTSIDGSSPGVAPTVAAVATSTPESMGLPVVAGLPEDLLVVMGTGEVVRLYASEDPRAEVLFVLPGDLGRPPTLAAAGRDGPYLVSDFECDSTIWELGDNPSDSRAIAQGRSPAIGPRGERLAYVAKRHLRTGEPRPLGESGCAHNSLVVRDLSTGTETEWLLPPELVSYGIALNELSWSPDGTRLAFDAGFEDGSAHVFDVTTPPGELDLVGSLVNPSDEARDALAPGWRTQDYGSGSLWNPHWVDNSTIVASYHCCYSNNLGQGGVQIGLSDGATVVDTRFGERRVIDIDATGDNLLSWGHRTDGSRLLVWTGAAGNDTTIEADIVAAVWLPPS